MAKKALDAKFTLRLRADVLQRIEDCADAERMDVNDVMRQILDRASVYRLNKLRAKGLAPPPREYIKK